MADPKILQMMPAEGWFALFSDEENDILMEPLVCFALVEDEDGYTEIRPMNWQGTAVDYTDEADGFLGIEHVSMVDSDFEDELDLDEDTP